MKFNLDNIVKKSKQRYLKNSREDIKKIEKKIKNTARKGFTNVWVEKEDLKNSVSNYVEYFKNKGFKTRETTFNDLEIKWDIPTKPTYYVILEDNKIHALCTNDIDAQKLYDKLVEKAIEECFAVDPKESGLNKKTDYNMIKEQCEDDFSIFEINDLNELLKEEN